MTREECIDEEIELLACQCDECEAAARDRLGKIWDAGAASERERLRETRGPEWASRRTPPARRSSPHAR